MHLTKLPARLVRYAFALLLGGLSTQTQAAEPPRIVVAMPGPNLAPFLPMELMPRIGADARAGFHLSVRNFGGGPLCVKDMVERNSDFAGLGMPALAGIRLSTPNLFSIAALTQVPAYVLMVRQNLKRRVHRLADLRGRTIGAHSGSKVGKSTARQIAEYLLIRDGVNVDEINFVHAGQNLADYSTALQSGQVDAIVVNEPAATLLEKHKLAWRMVDLHDAKVAKQRMGGKFLYTQLATTRETIETQPDKIRMLTSALRDSLRWIASHSAHDIVARLDLPDGEEKQALEHFLTAHKNLYSPDGAFSAEAMRNSEAFFQVVSADNPAAAHLRYADLVDSRWSGVER